ncbi:adenylate/guanylate cyclase domain-containing protein [Ramlibacter sp. USB13]|uniref:Adenylate/guanylate cyclase domain-containing protein n=1 Tax=Ramlibacter cellulosilyticus TaxID=2764187 RepID=A0A923SC80_9BURK|nr:adenylate/guanylate cyclase domain-containing protein [Ramlibacter cellulosilyticus]MBC5783958.1 adenylate/guanylate cyclase domain-containing protein [Ramlibacter cellulosilyticus]
MSAISLARSPFTRARKVIAVADVVESVRLMERGEEAFIERWHRFVDFVQEQIPAHGGRLHKSLGDGVMLEFADADGCIRAVLSMQAWFRDVNQGLPTEDHVHLRIGAHLAVFVADQYDIYGTDVNVAARIASLAGPGEVVISAALRAALGRTLAVRLVDLGECHLKHVKQRVHAYRVAQATETPELPGHGVDPAGLRAAVAVLPFALPGQQGDTLSDELIAGLARSDALQVVSRMTTPALDATRDTLQAELQEVGARYVLTGRPRSQGGALSLYLELADAVNGHVMWAENFQGAADAAGVLDSRLRSQAVAAVHSAVIEHEMELAATRRVPALEGSTLLLGALGLMHRLSPVDMEQARHLLVHLLDRWRRHPTGNAWLAHLHVLRVQQTAAGFAQHDAALARAHAAAAAQSDPGSPLVLALDGYSCLHGMRNLEAAAERYAQALSLRPQHSVALLFHAELQALRGAARSARAAALTARSLLVLEPMRYLYDAIAALAALADGDPEAAAGLAQLAVQRNPRYLPAWRSLIVAQVECDRLGEAHASQQQLLKRLPAFTVRGFIGSTPLTDGLEARFADALLQAGAPAH